jgi:nicotinamide phosphoribosyltransferase
MDRGASAMEQINNTVQTVKLAVGPKDKDVRYTSKKLNISLILRADSYKFSHAFVYPENVRGMTCYGEARVPKSTTVVPFGMQVLLKKYLTEQITELDVQAAKQFSVQHFGRPLFAESAWLKVVNEYDGYLPLIIRSIPEGFPVRGGDPLYSVTCLDPELFWMAAYFETLVLRGIWYPTTIATLDRLVKADITRLYETSGADQSLIPFALHDFGGRGVTCAEQAELGGAAHLVNFMGSDTVEGISTANFYYNEQMAAFSVPATEHSIECSFGLDIDGERAYLQRVLTELAKPGGIVSIVIDGKDMYRCAELLCTEFKELIVNSGCKVVLRPDSGDMLETVPRLLHLLSATFGYTLNDKGFKKINNVGVIQGDGIDRQGLAIRTLLGKVVYSLGYTSDNVVFGSGGGLLQGVNRDTLKFAQKASAILVQTGDDFDWIGISKDPITDPGKKSKEGLMTLARSKVDGGLISASLLNGLDPEFEDLHELVYYNGVLYNETTLAEVRERAKI